MAYRSDIPLDSDQIRDGGDLELLQDNFAALGPVALSGLNGLIVGGANAAGAVPQAQSSAGNAPWFAQQFSAGDVGGFTTAGMPVSGMLQWDGTQFAPGAILSGAFVSGQLAKSDGSKQVPGIIIHEAGIAVSGILQWDGTKLVPGHVISGAFVSGQMPRWDGAKFVPGVRIAQDGIAISGFMQWDGDQFVRGRGISGAFVSGQYFKADANAYVPALRFDTSTMPLSGVAQYDGAKITSGFAVLVSGIVSGQLLSWDESLGAFTIGDRIAGAGITSPAPVGEYLCHMTFSAAQVQSAANNSNVLIAAATVRRNVGGFTTESGKITIPTGNGYTHAIVRAGLQCSGAAAPAGLRRIMILISGGAQSAGVDSETYTYAGTPIASLRSTTAPVLTANTPMNLWYNSPLIPISGGEKASFIFVHLQGATLGVFGGATGSNVFLQVQCFKLTSGGVG